MADWTLFEVFVRSKHGLNHKHVGSVHAADATMALENARELYTRRSEGVSIWVVRADETVMRQPVEVGPVVGVAAVVVGLAPQLAAVHAAQRVVDGRVDEEVPRRVARLPI